MMNYTTNGIVVIVHIDTSTGMPSRRHCARLAVVAVYKNLDKASKEDIIELAISIVSVYSL